MTDYNTENLEYIDIDISVEIINEINSQLEFIGSDPIPECLMDRVIAISLHEIYHSYYDNNITSTKFGRPVTLEWMMNDKEFKDKFIIIHKIIGDEFIACGIYENDMNRLYPNNNRRNKIKIRDRNLVLKDLLT